MMMDQIMDKDVMQPVLQRYLDGVVLQQVLPFVQLNVEMVK